MGCVCSSDNEKSKKNEMRINNDDIRSSTTLEKRNIENQHIQSFIHETDSPYLVSYNLFNLNNIFLHSENDRDFNFPELDNEDVYVGESVKRMRAFKSKIDNKDLNKKRKEFWETRIEGDKRMWEVLRVCCEDIEEKDIKLYMDAAGIRLFNDCINRCYDPKGFLYEIPNYCINDPYKYELEDIHKRVSLNKDISLYIRNFNRNFSIRLKDSDFVINLKKLISEHFIKEEKKSVPIEKISLYYGGYELKDTNNICDYNISSNSIIQLNIKLSSE